MSFENEYNGYVKTAVDYIDLDSRRNNVKSDVLFPESYNGDDESFESDAGLGGGSFDSFEDVYRDALDEDSILDLLDEDCDMSIILELESEEEFMDLEDVLEDNDFEDEIAYISSLGLIIPCRNNQSAGGEEISLDSFQSYRNISFNGIPKNEESIFSILNFLKDFSLVDLSLEDLF